MFEDVAAKRDVVRDRLGFNHREVGFKVFVRVKTRTFLSLKGENPFRDLLANKNDGATVEGLRPAAREGRYLNAYSDARTPAEACLRL